MAKVIEELGAERKVDLLRQMMIIRRFEERAAEMYANRKIGGFLHLYIGQEAVAVGAISVLRDGDYVISHYREHGHAIARGVDPARVMAELFGKVTGVSRGRGGSMHLFDAEKNFMGGYAIVAGHMPLACGLGFACQYLNKDCIVLNFFGDGAVNEGEFHESLNLAGVWKLPVLFLCENNLYAMGTPIHKTSAVTEVYRRASAYDIPSQRVNGMDLLEVHEAAKRAADYVRQGNGPYLIEALTYRFRGHSMADPELYRTKQEVEEWRARDPIVRFQRELESEGILTDEDWQRLVEEIDKLSDEWVRFADESPDPPLETLYEDVYA